MLQTKYVSVPPTVAIGSMPELPAQTCKEIKASEGQAVSGDYWFDSIVPGNIVLASCNMETEGGIYLLLNKRNAISLTM